MKKLMLVCLLILAVVVSQSIFAQDKPVEKKIEKVVKVKKHAGKKTDEAKMECCKDKKCCDKCTGEKCDGKCCAKCAECKKECEEKCDKDKMGKCAMDSTANCEKMDMKKHVKKIKIKKEVKEEEKQ
jgi:hypothetical protein